MIQGLRQEARMGRRSRVQRTPEEKLAIVMEAMKSGNVAETCRKHEVAPTLYYRWKDEMEKGALAALGGRAQPRSPPTSKASASSNWSGRWASLICRSRS
jgi:transposase-like protein